MEDFVTTFTQLFSNLGVPVACLVASFWMLNKEREDHKSEVDALRTEYTTVLKEMNTAINNNTVALEKLEMRLNNGN